MAVFFTPKIYELRVKDLRFQHRRRLNKQVKSDITTHDIPCKGPWPPQFEGIRRKLAGWRQMTPIIDGSMIMWHVKKEVK